MSSVQVRPFTLGQLKELLSRTGTLVEEGFWIDRIKSHCYVTVSLAASPAGGEGFFFLWLMVLLLCSTAAQRRPCPRGRLFTG